MSVRTCFLFFLLVIPASCLRADEQKDTKFDSKQLIGKWTYESGQKNGEQLGKSHFAGQIVSITKDKFTLGDEEFVMEYEIMEKEKPVGIKLTMTKSPFGTGATTSGILKLDGDQLKFCYAAMGGAAPTKFEANDGSGHHLFVLKKMPEKLTKEAILGVWNFISGKKDGEATDTNRYDGMTVEITKDMLTLKGQETFEMEYELDSKADPATIQLTITKGPFGEGEKAKGILKLKKNQLSICYNPTGDAPKTFESKAGSGHFLFELKRSEKK